MLRVANIFETQQGGRVDTDQNTNAGSVLYPSSILMNEMSDS